MPKDIETNKVGVNFDHFFSFISQNFKYIKINGKTKKFTFLSKFNFYSLFNFVISLSTWNLLAKFYKAYNCATNYQNTSTRKERVKTNLYLWQYVYSKKAKKIKQKFI